MADLAGGLRSRLMERSVLAGIRTALDALGWFDAGRQHAPINLVAHQYELDEEVPLNTVAVWFDNVDENPEELGSGLTEHSIDLWVDVYAQDDSLGKHLADDIRDVLAGRMAAAGRSDPSFAVSDLDDDPLFVVQIENTKRARARGFPHPWQRHWWVVSATVIDTYDGG